MKVMIMDTQVTRRQNPITIPAIMLNPPMIQDMAVMDQKALREQPKLAL